MYSLAEIRAWPSDRGIQGFELIYKVPEDYTGYLPHIKMFGSSADVGQYTAVQFDSQVDGDLILRSDDKVLKQIQLFDKED